MKATILAASIAAFFVNCAAAQTSPIVIQHASDPSLTLQLEDGSSSHVPLSSAIFRYNQDVLNVEGDLFDRSLTMFDADLTEASWLWRSPGGTMMRLDNHGVDGETSLSLSAIGASTPGMYFSAYNGSGLITFADGGYLSASGLTLKNNSTIYLGTPGGSGGTINFGNSVYLNRNGSNLRIGTSNIITESTGDSRYLKLGTNQNRIAFGTNATVVTDHAFAFGKNASANGVGATAFGDYVSATGVGAVALGRGLYDGSGGFIYPAQASGQGATSIGYCNRALADFSVSMGVDNSVEGPYSSAFGWGSHIHSGSHGAFVGGLLNDVWSQAGVALGQENFLDVDAGGSAAIGAFNHVYGWAALAVGNSNYVHGPASIALGYANTTNGFGSFSAGRWNETGLKDGTHPDSASYGSAIGVGIQSAGTGQFVIGSYNLALFDASPSVHTDTDALFIIGNGYQSNSGTQIAFSDYVVGHAATRSNAFVVRWNGKTEASGNVQSKATTGFNKFAAPVLVPEGGDISMGDFKAGELPN